MLNTEPISEDSRIKIETANAYFANSSASLAINPVFPCATLSDKEPIPNVTIGKHNSLPSSAAKH